MPISDKAKLIFSFTEGNVDTIHSASLVFVLFGQIVIVKSEGLLGFAGFT